MTTKLVCENDRVVVIAEAGANHNGDLKLALDLVESAADARADFVKFQTFKTEKLVTRAAKKAEYQLATTDPEQSQREMLAKLELSQEDHHRIVEKCAECNIQFLSSAFDADSLKFLCRDLGMKVVKLGSGEVTDAPLLLNAARSDATVILSTGMSLLSEVEQALGVLAYGYTSKLTPESDRDFSDALMAPDSWAILKERVVLLHCTTEYPAPVAQTNLRAIDTLRTAFGLRVGYSDHTEGNLMSFAAVARGAKVIEKHFTIDKRLEGPDHKASVEPDELRDLVDGIRAIELGLGDGLKYPGKAEIKNRPIARKFLVASRKIYKGSLITAADLTTKRVGDGITGVHLWACIGKRASCDIEADTPIVWSMFR